MLKERIVLVGSGQHARVVLYNLKKQGLYDVACFLDADESKVGQFYEGYKIVGTYDDLDAIKKIYNTNKFFIAFGNMKYRKSVFNKFINEGWEAVNIFHPDAVISTDAKIGKGVLIECGCMIAPNPVIGDNVVVNMGSQINHDNIVESHVFIAGGVILSGGVIVRENTLLDDGVVVMIGRTVPANSIFGAGSVVTKSFEEEGNYIGVPAKLIRER